MSTLRSMSFVFIVICAGNEGGFGEALFFSVEIDLFVRTRHEWIVLCLFKMRKSVANAKAKWLKDDCQCITVLRSFYGSHWLPN